MTDRAIGVQAAAVDSAPPIRWGNLVWVALALAVMVAAILSGVHWFLNFVHVVAGVLWTGIDLFMGFVVGPIMRSMPFPARRALIARLMPKMLFLMPTVSAITGTAGWFLAQQSGYLQMDFPQLWWVIAALVIVTILTIQGLFFLLPTNLRVYFEVQKPQPDGAKIARLMRWYIYVVASQGALQIAIIVVMARFVTGV
jgi:hypothetical protein